MLKHPWLSACVFACLMLLGTAGHAAAQSNEAPVNPNIGHKHHHHSHGHPHPTVQDPDRFHTDRPSPRMLPLPTEQDAFTFVVFGDRTGGPAEGVSVLADAVRDTNLIEPDFVITVGDLVQGYNETPEWMEQMREYKQIMGHLKSPWFPVAGNHDVYWRDKDGSGDAKPMGEHESEYEMHFGPLWYAFEHKNNWFIALYSDEGNPETGEKAIGNPESQRMSPEQLAWLEQTLEKAKDADHVFLFLHHPRWRGRNYGDDWDKVHKLLVKAGNVSAVFAGHIHYMTYEGPKDGIEYVSLATVGGHNSFTVPEVGYLHHFNIVTVRKDQISMAAVPVGEVIDPREITQELQQSAVALTRRRPGFEGTLAFSADGGVESGFSTTLDNPTQYAIDVTLRPQSRDSRWSLSPDHDHATIAPGESRTFTFEARRMAGAVDESLHLGELVLETDLLTDAFRYTLPQSATPLPTDLRGIRAQDPQNQVLAVGGNEDHVAIPSNQIRLSDGPMTLETWMRADRFDDRVGLVTKAQNSDYGLFVNDGRPTFSIFLGNRYASVRSDKVLETDTWHHIAGVYDGKEVRLYVDGQLAGRRKAGGARKTNNLPLIVGADVDGAGRATSPFTGQIDAVHLSDTARYVGDSLEPARRPEADDHSLLLLNFDEQIGDWLFDDSPQQGQFESRGNARVLKPAA